MVNILIPTGTLVKDEILEIGKLLLKCGYEVNIGNKKVESGKNLKCISFKLPDTK